MASRELIPLVNLHNGRAGIRSGLQVRISEPPPCAAGAAGTDADPKLPLLDFVASDETLDRCEEIISARGWQLESYRRNPVFQNAHQYGDIIFTLGKALITEVRLVSGRPALFQRVQFATEANPIARVAYALYRGAFLNAVSVGFIPLRWENADAVPPAGDHGPATGGPGPRRGFRRRYLEQELLEVSAVGIPANPNALQLGLKSGALLRSDLEELFDFFQRLSNSAPQAAAATGGNSKRALLESVRELGNLLHTA